MFNKLITLSSLILFNCTSGNLEPSLITLEHSQDICEDKQSNSITQKNNCPSDMVEVEGEHCEGVVHVCKKWISEKKDRCAEYVPMSKCLGKVSKLHFCEDKYEWPNKEGEYPEVGISYIRAKELCESVGKRLCTRQEWTKGCEGEANTPYPNGYVRDSSKCVYDRIYIEPNADRYMNLATRDEEIKRISKVEPSGSNPGCASSYGIQDTVGNSDEWVYDPNGHPNGPYYFQSALMGGYHGPVRNRCRPVTATHSPSHHYYQSGARCCKDIKN